MKREYVITIMLLALLVACSAPVMGDPDLVVEDKKIEHLNYTGRYLLHLSTALDLSNPVSSDWWECWPIYDRWWDLASWTDTQPDDKLNEGDIISMTNMTDVTWYHVDRLTFRLSVWSETTFVPRYLDSRFDYHSGGLNDPTGYWKETFPDYAQSWEITNWIDDNGNSIVDDGDQVYMVNLDDGGLTEWYRVKDGGWPIAPAVLIAMSVSELCAPCYNYSCYCQTPKEFVAEHTYDVDVLIKNDGGDDSGAFIVSLYDNLVTVDTKRVNGLGSGADNNTTWVRFQWHPVTHGSHQLKVMVDSDNEVEELSETNNDLTQNEVVLLPGDPELDAYPCCIDFSPAWMSDATNITVTVLNNGTGDACCFTVNVTMTSDRPGDSDYPWSDCVTTSVCAKAYKNITFTSPELTMCCNYTVTVRLDTENDVDESDEGNNEATKQLMVAMCGDVNRDGFVNAIDIVLLDQKVWQPPKTLCCGWAGDVNCDGFVNAIDIVLLDQKVWHPPKTLGCCEGCELW